MLTHLKLKDLAIVDQAELELGPGMTALTGETGAGKSIVVDALLLAAGDRAGADVVRHGAERAEVTASFASLPAAATEWLTQQSIELDGDLIIRRVIGADGRSRAYVNGQVVPLQALRTLSEHLLEIHGQQEFQRLVSRAAQRELLDARLDDPQLKRTVGDLFARYRRCREQAAAMQETAQNRDARLELLRYQVQELKEEATSVAAIEELFADQKRISGKGRLSAAARTALTAVYEADSDSAHDLLGRAQAALRGVADCDATLAEAAKLLSEAVIQTRECAQVLRRYLVQLDLDPGTQDEIERRAAALESLARKHRVDVLQLPSKLERLEQELQLLELATDSLVALQTQLTQLAVDYRSAAAHLTQARQAAALRLSSETGSLMQGLGMTGGSFSVQVSRSDAEFSAGGSDEIEFLVSANPGQPLRSLAKVASGGELSRISLALQVAAAGGSAALCMVFDEVDAGIGGAVAEIVGRRLRELGDHGQVLCVTHLPQVASQAHRQIRVTKITDGKATRTALSSLNGAQRVEEISRMLGGIDITEQARAHARQMLSDGEAPGGGTAKKKRPRAAQR